MDLDLDFLLVAAGFFLLPPHSFPSEVFQSFFLVEIHPVARSEDEDVNGVTPDRFPELLANFFVVDDTPVDLAVFVALAFLFGKCISTLGLGLLRSS